MGVHTGDSITVARRRRSPTRNTSACATPHRGAAQDRRRHRRLERAVRHQRQNGRVVVIEMNPRVSRSVGAGVEGDRFPDRQGRRQARRRLHARRAEERDHRRQDPASFEPADRLRGHKIPRFAFEKFPAADARLTTADEVGGRGDGDRPHCSRNRCRRRCAGWKPAGRLDPTGST